MNTSVDSIWHRENWARDRSGPLYMQLRQHIENAILSGQLNAGEPLPSEREIASIGNVSRVTVRKAVTELAQKGFVVQKRGSGTTVAPPEEKLQQSLSRLTSFSEDMSRRGQSVSSTPLERGLFSPSPQETLTLGLPADSLVARISRLRLADGLPLAIERASLSPQFLPHPEKVDGSLYALSGP